MPSLRDDLLALSQAPAPPTLAAVIRGHLVEIERALEAGRRYSEIIDQLRPHGLSPTVEIFRKTLARIRKEGEAPRPVEQVSTSSSRKETPQQPASSNRSTPAVQPNPDYLNPAARRTDIEQWFKAPKPNPLFDLATASTKVRDEGST